MTLHIGDINRVLGWFGLCLVMHYESGAMGACGFSLVRKRTVARWMVDGAPIPERRIT